jgi:hypothetical protein
VTEFGDIKRGDVETAKRYLSERSSIDRETLHMIGMTMNTTAQMEAVFEHAIAIGIEITGAPAR